MPALINGSRIYFDDGTYATIIKELGSGGQGTVYLVEWQGKQMAFKWYKDCPKSDFINNLKENIVMGKPSDEFLWPQAVATGQYGSYGYLMGLKPKGFHDLSDFILAKVRFKDDHAQIKAALSICTAFQKLHLKGLSYFDLNDGNFFINPINGEVLIGDNDNAAPDKQNISHIKGKCRYMAPEVVKGSDPDKYSDFFSLAVILFRLFFIDHPLEGKFNHSCPCLTEQFERLLYGEKPLFIFDENNKSNEATSTEKNAIRMWPLAPISLRAAFIKAFNYENLHNPTKRMTDGDWVKTLLQMRSATCHCPTCGELTYIEKEDHGRCKECKNKRPIYWLLIGNKTFIPLALGQKIYASQLLKNIDHHTVNAEIIPSRTHPNKIGIRNMSSFDWIVSINGQSKVIKPEDVIPIIDNATIKFGNFNTGLIRLILPS